MNDFISLFGRIALDAPWLMPWANIHHAFQDTRHTDDELAWWLNRYFDQQNIALCHHDFGNNLCFVAQDDLPHGTAYERFIYQNHKIPTRNNLHDWFGACIWSAFPKSKALLNAKHHAHMNTDNQRNRLRDTITVFDENGAIVVVSDETLGYEIAQALTHFDWQTCLVKHRKHWHNPKNPKPQDKAQVFVFGHALLEQLISPYKSLCSHTLFLPVPPPFFEMALNRQLAFLDDFLCRRLDRFLTDKVTPRDLQPLPILGVPHFWDNDDPAFYEDRFVFRSGRQSDKR